MNEELQEEIFFQEVFEYPIQEFKKHLESKENLRIFFSGKFGIGKTSFIKKFFETENQQKEFKFEKYKAYHLYPINYSVSSNEDIIRYIKYDIIWELLRNNDVAKEEKTTLSQTLIKYLKSNLDKVLAALIFIIPKIGKDISEAFDKWKLIQDQITNLYEEDSKTDGDRMIDEINKIKIEEGGLYENDLLTNMIFDTIKLNKLEDQKSILIIDDLDRLDPEHVFRILNVFAAHFDYEREGRLHKFGFDKIMIVCDFNNIRNVYHNRYGMDVDFMGYIDKFYSSGIYFFDNKTALSNIIERIFNLSTFSLAQNRSDESSIRRFYFRNAFLFRLINLLIEKNFISLRNLVNVPKKIINYHYQKIIFNDRNQVDAWRLPIAIQLKFLNLCLGDYKNMYKVLKSCSSSKFFIEGYKEYFGLLLYLITAKDFMNVRDDDYECSYNNISFRIKTDSTFPYDNLERANVLKPSGKEDDYFEPSIELFWDVLVSAVEKLESVSYIC